MRRPGLSRGLVVLSAALALGMGMAMGSAAEAGGRGALVPRSVSAKAGPRKQAAPRVEAARALVRPVAKPAVLKQAENVWRRLGREPDSNLSARSAVIKHMAATRLLLKSVGIGEARVDEAVHHLALGMPTPAGRTDANNYLLARNEYMIGYSRDLVAPKWASWRLTAADIDQEYLRKDRFRPDPTLPDTWPRALKRDFKRSGWTRGHLVASGERSARRRSNVKTFTLSNVVPQAEKNNAGPWNHFENYYRELAAAGHDVYVLAGSVFAKDPPRIGMSGVAVPETTWKIAVILDKGQSIADIGPSTRVVSIAVPNDNRAVSIGDSFARFRTTPRAIQEMTGHTFFTSLPTPLRDHLLDKLDQETIPEPTFEGKPWKQRAVESERRRSAEAQGLGQARSPAPTATPSSPPERRLLPLPPPARPPAPGLPPASTTPPSAMP